MNAKLDLRLIKMLKKTIKILERLVAIPSFSGKPTNKIVGYIKEYLESFGVEVILSFDAEKKRANVFASFGPKLEGGVLLNGHTDVIPQCRDRGEHLLQFYSHYSCGEYQA